MIQNTSPLLITPSPHPTINFPRMRIFKTGFRKLSILSKFWKWGIWQGVEGGNLVYVIMTHCVRRSICDSPLIQWRRCLYKMFLYVPFNIEIIATIKKRQLFFLWYRYLRDFGALFGNWSIFRTVLIIKHLPRPLLKKFYD